MSILYRKLAMLEEDMKRRIEASELEDFCTPCIDIDLKNRLSSLMDKVRLH